MLKLKLFFINCDGSKQLLVKHWFTTMWILMMKFIMSLKKNVDLLKNIHNSRFTGKKMRASIIRRKKERNIKWSYLNFSSSLNPKKRKLMYEISHKVAINYIWCAWKLLENSLNILKAHRQMDVEHISINYLMVNQQMRVDSWKERKKARWKVF